MKDKIHYFLMAIMVGSLTFININAFATTQINFVLLRFDQTVSSSSGTSPHAGKCSKCLLPSQIENAAGNCVDPSPMKRK